MIKEYQAEAFFNGVESLEHVESTRCFFLKRAKTAFPNKECHPTEQVVGLLYQRLVELSAELEQIGPTQDDLDAIHQKWHTISGDLEQYVQDRRMLLLDSTNEIPLLTQGKKQWERYRAGKSIMFTFFFWLPAVHTKRHYQMKLLLGTTFGRRMTAFQESQPDGIDTFIDELIGQAHKEQAGYQQQIDHAEDVSQCENGAVIRWCEITHSLGYTGETELNLSRADGLADAQFRLPAFLLATHYWEDRWLMDMATTEDLQKENDLKGTKAIKAHWLCRMKLTPCVVMTYFMPPHHILIRRRTDGKEFDDGYLYNFADLLIVDGARQVLPEVVAASFVLAKEALVIGDTKRIAFIWNSLPCINIGDMVEEHILPEGSQGGLTESYILVCESGRSVVSGSAMRATWFNLRCQYDPGLARGIYPYEHRRCFDNIIDYYNTLSYHGKLQPR